MRAGIFSIDVNGRGSTAAVFIVGAFLCFAVNVDLFASAGFHGTVCYRCFIAVTEAAAAGFICNTGLRAGYFDLSSGTELVFVVNTGDCAAVKNCHSHVLLR